MSCTQVRSTLFILRPLRMKETVGIPASRRSRDLLHANGKHFATDISRNRTGKNWVNYCNVATIQSCKIMHRYTSLRIVRAN